MEIGVALPQMAPGLDRERVAAWCHGIDAGPYASVSAGERITFRNLECLTLCAAAAALTHRVRVLANVVVLPWHRLALVAKQLATIDVLSGGRLEVAVGVGGRVQDYQALAVSTERRHQRLDEDVAEVRRLWAGEPAADGAVVGPAPLRSDGPRILASSMGPRSLARAARWADGVSGFSLFGDAREAGKLFRAAEQAWAAAGRSDRPLRVTGTFFALGPEAPERLRSFAYDYLEVFSPEVARHAADTVSLTTPERVRELVSAMEVEGCDELILVPADSDPACLERLTETLAD